jgi:hypothetical protein
MANYHLWDVTKLRKTLVETSNLDKRRDIQTELSWRQHKGAERDVCDSNSQAAPQTSGAGVSTRS